MRSSLKLTLFAAVTLLAFYVGYAGFGVTRADVCTTEVACSETSCAAAGLVWPQPCYNKNNTQMKACVPDNNPNDTCQSSQSGYFTCTGVNQNGYQC